MDPAATCPWCHRPGPHFRARTSTAGNARESWIARKPLLVAGPDRGSTTGRRSAATLRTGTDAPSSQMTRSMDFAVTPGYTNAPCHRPRPTPDRRRTGTFTRSRWNRHATLCPPPSGHGQVLLPSATSRATDAHADSSITCSPSARAGTVRQRQKRCSRLSSVSHSDQIRASVREKHNARPLARLRGTSSRTPAGTTLSILRPCLMEFPHETTCCAWTPGSW